MNNSNDHDLLIRVDTQLINLTQEVRLMREGANERLNKVEINKLDKANFDEFKMEQLEKDQDHEKRMRRIERTTYIGIGVLGCIEFIISIVK